MGVFDVVNFIRAQVVNFWLAPKPELVKQEFYGLLMAHFAVRGLMHEAALQAEEDPDRLSFLHSVRVVQRRMARSAAIPPRQRKTVHVAVLGEILQERCVSSRNRLKARGVKRKLSNYPLRPRKAAAYATNRALNSDQKSLTEQYWG